MTFRIRIAVANASDAVQTLNYELRMSKNGGAYNAVTTTSTNGVKSADAGSDVDGTPIFVPRLSIP
jgi:hypothetical protein